MKYFTKTLVITLCLNLLSGAMPGQATGFFRTHQSGDWNSGSTWERYNGSSWVWPAPTPTAATSDGILIVAGHEVTISTANLTVDQLRVDGMLTVKFVSTLTIADGPGVDFEQDNPASFTRIQGKLVNKGSIQIKQGGFQIGTVDNQGEMVVGGVFQFNSGIITGNDIRYGPTGSLVINFPGYTVDQEDQLWPTVNGPAKVSVTNSLTLNDHRTVSDSLDVSGNLHVVGRLTNNGTARISGTLQLTGTFENNGSTEIPGTVQMHPTGSVTGNPLVYTGCCSRLEFRGADASYQIEPENLFWPENNGPESVVVPSAGLRSANVILNATRTIGQLDLSFYGTFVVDGTLTINTGGEIDGVLVVNGMFVNNGAPEIHRCRVSGNLVNNGTLQIGSFFQLDEGGQASGNDFIYIFSGNLIFNNTSGPFEINAGGTYWPATNGPGNIVVQGGGIAVNVARMTSGSLQVAGPVTNASNLTISGTLQMEAGGSFDTAPIYNGYPTLIYQTGDSIDAGPEWSSGTTVGIGVPANVEITAGTTLKMPDSARRCPGNMSIRGTLVLGTINGADLSAGGNWENYGTIISNSRQLIFDGESHQFLTGETTVDRLTVNNPVGLSIPGHCEAASTDMVTVRQMLRFIDGHILLGNCSGILTILDSVSGYSDDRYIITLGNGMVWGLIQAGEELQFPIGLNHLSYNPLTVALDPSDFNERLFIVRVDSGVSLQEGDPSDYVQRTWTVIPDCFSGKLTFQWNEEEEGLNFNRNAASVYNGDIEILPEGAPAGTDPYTIRTGDEFSCPEFPQHLFIVGNSKTFTAVQSLNTTDFLLDQNQPNPFYMSTLLRYSIPETGHVILTVYDVLGREIERLLDEQQAAGVYEKHWTPAGLSTGLYFCRLQLGNRIAVKRMNLLR